MRLHGYFRALKLHQDVVHPRCQFDCLANFSFLKKVKQRTLVIYLSYRKSYLIVLWFGFPNEGSNYPLTNTNLKWCPFQEVIRAKYFRL